MTTQTSPHEKTSPSDEKLNVKEHVQDMASDVQEHVPAAFSEMVGHAKDMAGDVQEHAQDALSDMTDHARTMSSEVAHHSQDAVQDVLREIPVLAGHFRDNVVDLFDMSKDDVNDKQKR